MLEPPYVWFQENYIALPQLSSAYQCIGHMDLPYLGSKFIGKDKDNSWVGSRNVDETNLEE